MLYDIAVLGFGHANNLSRTGIFRVVEHGALGLMTSSKCDVTFCTSQSNYSQCNDYLSSLSSLPVDKVNIPEDPLSRIYSFIEPSRIRVHQHAKHPLKNNLVRYLYHAGKKFTRPISDKNLSNVMVYHSPANPIPFQVTKNRRIKPFITIHDIIPLVREDLAPTGSKSAMKSLLASITPETGILTVSQYSKEDLCNYLPDLEPDRVTVTHLAAGEHFYRCNDRVKIDAVRARYNIPEGAKYLLTLGTLQPRKNIQRTVRCFAKTIQEGHIRDLYLLLVGVKGWDYDTIFKEIESSGVGKDKIIVTGYVPDNDLAPLYTGALAFIFLSLYEGFGLPPLEAMKCGTPVISSNTSSLPEVVGNAGILVNPLDEDSICNEMFTIYNNFELKNNLSQLSLDRSKVFCWEKYRKQVVAAYQSVL